MSQGDFTDGPGFGALGLGGPGFRGFGEPGFGGGPGGAGAGGFGPGSGSGRGLKCAAFGAALVLLEGPASAAQVVERVTESSGGAVTPPGDVAQLAIGLLAGRGLVSVNDGVAKLTELVRNLPAWRGEAGATSYLKDGASLAVLIAS